MKTLPILSVVVVLVFFMVANTAQADIFANELVSYSSSLDGSGWYNDPTELVGAPATYCANWSETDHISIVEPAWGDGSLTTLNEGDWAIVKFDHAVTDDANNPYGFDFIAYGNTLFWGSGTVYDTTDHTDYYLTGAANTEQVVISVSQDGENWYAYENGPYGDSLYPTNPWKWDPDLYASTGNGWTDEQNDYTLPVDPTLTLDDFADLSTYEAMLLYEGSAGGTGFDLAESGYDWIQYIKVEGISNKAGGEIDAFVDVAPVPVPGALCLMVSGLVCGVAALRAQYRRDC